MEHLSKIKLEKYAKRELSADEMTSAILHLDECKACFENLQQVMIRQETAVSFAFFDDGETQFHLDYEEHLRPFVDKEADAVTREIVESHTRQCAMCARELRDLREFAESLRMREIEKAAALKPNFGDSLRRFLKARFAQTALAFSFLLIFIIGGIFLFQSGTQNSANENASPEIALVKPPIESKILETPSPKSEISNANLKVETANKKPEATKTPLATEEKTPEIVNPTNTDQSKENDISAELNNLPSEIRANVKSVLQTGKLEFPAFLASLRENIKLRGATGEISAIIYPYGEAVRETSPVLSWSKFAASDEKYIVEIIDENNNSIFTGNAQNQTKFRLPIALKRGQIYKIEVRSVEKESPANVKSVMGKFKVLEQNTLADLEKISTAKPLVRGIALASAGLLTGAKREFRQAFKAKKDLQKARKFLTQISDQK